MREVYGFYFDHAKRTLTASDEELSYREFPVECQVWTMGIRFRLLWRLVRFQPFSTAHRLEYEPGRITHHPWVLGISHARSGRLYSIRKRLIPLAESTLLDRLLRSSRRSLAAPFAGELYTSRYPKSGSMHKLLKTREFLVWHRGCNITLPSRPPSEATEKKGESV